ARGQNEPIKSIVFSNDSSRVAVLGKGSVKVWPLSSGQESTALGYTLPIIGRITFNAEGSRLAFFNPERPQIQVWDIATGKEVDKHLLPTKLVQHLAFEPGGTLSIVARGSRLVNKKVQYSMSGHEYPGAKTLFEVDVAANPLTSVVSADGKRVAILG